jgi:hypothetical protein
MVLSPTFITFEAINAFTSLGHKGYMPMIEPSKVTIEIRKEIPIWFISYVHNSCSKYFILLSSIQKRERTERQTQNNK